ncbi:MAG: hypothetical protein QXT82_06215 [Candidatus Caldarchaeum sp.]
MERGFSIIEAGLQLASNFEYFMLAEKYGWRHEDIMKLTRAEAVYYMLAPAAYEKRRKRFESRRDKLKRFFKINR